MSCFQNTRNSQSEIIILSCQCQNQTMFCSKRIVTTVTGRKRIITHRPCSSNSCSSASRKTVETFRPSQSSPMTTSPLASSGLTACAFVGLAAVLSTREQNETSEDSESRRISCWNGVTVPIARNPIMAATTTTTKCDGGFFLIPKRSRLARSRTVQHMHDTSTKRNLRSRYDVQWRRPL